MHAWKQKEARRDCKDPLLTSPSAASRASSSVTIAPDQDGKKRKESEKKERKKERMGAREREASLHISLLGA
jgi:CelD/BcsL family acetyltransferase involved in cellulose biosynthesis